MKNKIKIKMKKERLERLILDYIFKEKCPILEEPELCIDYRNNEEPIACRNHDLPSTVIFCDFDTLYNCQNSRNYKQLYFLQRWITHLLNLFMRIFEFHYIKSKNRNIYTCAFDIIDDLSFLTKYRKWTQELDG